MSFVTELNTTNHAIIKLEGSRNWNLWKFQIQVLLRGQGALEVVEQPEKKPADDSKEIKDWLNKDAKAQTIIVTRMTEEVMLHILSCTTAADMWQKLLNIYEQRSETSIHILHQRFFKYQYEEGTEISFYLSKIKEMQNQLKQLGEEVSDKLVITKILMSLPDRYSHFISAWESTPDDKQSYENLVSRLMIEQERMKEKGKEASEQSLALMAKKNNSFMMKQGFERSQNDSCLYTKDNQI